MILPGPGQLALGVLPALLALSALALLGRRGPLLLRVGLARCRAVAELPCLAAALLVPARSRHQGRDDQRQDHGAGDYGDDCDGAHLSLLLGVGGLPCRTRLPGTRGRNRWAARG